jgi:hypothetical protein
MLEYIVVRSETCERAPVGQGSVSVETFAPGLVSDETKATRASAAKVAK